MTSREAVALLEAITSMPEHSFWPCETGLSEAVKNWDHLFGHRQITDAYLLAQARMRHGILATLDRGVLQLPGAARYAELLGV